MSWLDALSADKPVLPPAPAAEAPADTKPIPPPGPAEPGTRPGDDYSARTDWAAILLPAGAVLHHQDASGERYWTRPGKDPRDGYSATTGYADDADRLKVFTSSWPPFTDGEVYTKFAAYCLLKHGGDYRAATRELGRLGYGSQQPGRRHPEIPADDAPWPSEPAAEPAAAGHGKAEQEASEPSAPLPEIPRFPVNKLDGPLRAFVDWAVRDGLHAECAVAAGLSVLAALTGPARLKLTATKTIKAILWIALVGVASSGKSPAYEHAFSIIRAAYRELRDQYEADLADWYGRVEAEGRAKAGPRPARPEPLEVDDVTTEAVARWLMARGADSSGAVVDDELAAFLEGLNQYKGGHGSDLSKWLKMWTGAPLHIQRVGNGGQVNEVSLYVPEPVVSVSGPLVPDNLHLLGRPGSGFRPRWLPFYAPSKKPAWNNAGNYPAAWQDCIARLIKDREPREWKLTPQARNKWELARNRWERRQDDPEPDDVIEALRKADTQALRIALILADSAGESGEITPAVMESAIAIVDYCLSVWRALPSNSTMTVSRREDVMDGAHRRLIAWLETRPLHNDGLPAESDPRPGATRRDVQQWLHEPARKLNELILEHRDRWPDCVVTIKPEHGGRPQTWLYAPRRAGVQTMPANVAATSPGEYVHPTTDDKTPGQDDSQARGTGVAVRNTGSAQHPLRNIAPEGSGGLRTVACPSCGEAAPSAVGPGEPAWCKHCETEYIAA